MRDLSAEGPRLCGFLAATEDVLETRVGDEIRELETGDVVSLGFYLELPAGEAGGKLVCRYVSSTLEPDSVEGIFQPAILTATTRLRHDVTDRALPLKPQYVSLEQHFLAIMVRVIVPHFVTLQMLVLINDDRDDV